MFRFRCIHRGVCVCVCVCEGEKERREERKGKGKGKGKGIDSIVPCLLSLVSCLRPVLLAPEGSPAYLQPALREAHEKKKNKKKSKNPFSLKKEKKKKQIDRLRKKKKKKKKEKEICIYTSTVLFYLHAYMPACMHMYSCRTVEYSTE